MGGLQGLNKSSKLTKRRCMSSLHRISSDKVNITVNCQFEIVHKGHCTDLAQHDTPYKSISYPTSDVTVT